MPPGEGSGRPFPLTAGERRELLDIARRAVTGWLRERKIPGERPDSEALRAPGAVPPIVLLVAPPAICTPSLLPATRPLPTAPVPAASPMSMATLPGAESPRSTIAPSVSLTSPGDPVSGTVTLQASASDDTGVVEVRFLAGGVLIGTDTTAPYSIEWDTTTAANGTVALTAEAEDAAGNNGTSSAVSVTVDNTTPVSFAAIQSTVFTPRCSGCHTGPAGNTLPGGLDLASTADSYAALVGVFSIQRPALQRVAAGNPDDSYLIRKLEGGPDIGGSRMPQGGPFLDQAIIDEIRQWITDGAPNN